MEKEFQEVSTDILRILAEFPTKALLDERVSVEHANKHIEDN